MFNQTGMKNTASQLLLCLGILLANQAAAVGAESKEKDKVLRHAVFFKFKDGTTKEELKGVVDAFRALPGKIEEIRGFELGESLPKSERNDGLTHCFLLTFSDEKGRDAYLPHAAHDEFVAVLRPHLDKVFVIDYWGRPQKKLPKKALKHAVFFKFKDGTPQDAVKKVEDGLAALPEKIDAIKGFEWGKNNSPEKHDQGFTHCFMFTFDCEKGLKEYMTDPTHVEVAKDLVPKMEKIRVIDFFAEEVPVKD
jgi:hypothetical protein